MAFRRTQILIGLAAVGVLATGLAPATQASEAGELPNCNMEIGKQAKSLQNCQVPESVKNADLSGWILSDITFPKENLGKLNLQGAVLNNVDMKKTELDDGSTLWGAKLTNVDFTDAVWNHVTAAGVNFETTILTGMSISNHTNLMNTQLSKVDFKNLHLTNVDFCGASIKNSEAEKVDFEGMLFAGVKISGSDFNGAKFDKVDLSSATINDNNTFENASFKGANLSNANITSTQHQAPINLRGANFDGANLSSITIQDNSTFENASFKGANLSNASIKSSQIPAPINLRGTNFDGADLSSITMDVVDFSNASLQGVKMPQAKVSGYSKFENANLDGANLRNTTFWDVHFEKISLKRALLWDTKWVNVNALWADMTQAYLNGAILAADNTHLGTNFTGAKNLRTVNVSPGIGGTRWDRAIWDNGKTCVSTSESGWCVF